jgi:anti-anti-sigma factor
MEEENITITIKPIPFIPNLTIITLKGSFDLSTSKYADEKVLPVIEKGDSNIIIDLSRLEYLSSIGMMSLTQYQVILTYKKRFLKLIKPPNHIYDTLVVTGVTKRFDIYDSSEEAIRLSR